MLDDYTPAYSTPTNLKYKLTRARRRRRQSLHRLRRVIRARDGGRCVYCGDLGEAIDHVIPHSKGGLDLLSNLVLACKRCNGTVHDRLFDSFEEKKEWILANRPKFDANPENRVIELCVDCFRAFRPRVGGATIFLCSTCMELQNDENYNQRLRRKLHEEGAEYTV